MSYLDCRSSVFKGLYRHLTTFYPAQNSYIEMSSAVNISVADGFDIEIDFEYISNGGSGCRLYGMPDSTSNLIKVFSPDASTDPYKLNMALGGQFISIANFMLPSDVGKINRLRIVTDGDDILFHLNDELRTTVFNKPALVGSFQLIGSGNSQDFAAGIQANARIWTGGNRETGTLTVFYPIDKDYNETDDVVLDESGNGNHATFVNVADGDSELYVRNSDGNFLGPELITQENWESPYTVTSGWTYDEVDNTWNLAGDGTAQGMFPLASFEQPLPLRVVANVLEVDGAGLLFSSAASTGAVTSTGVTTKIVTPDVGTLAQFKRTSGIVNAKIAKPSVRAYREVAY